MDIKTKKALEDIAKKEPSLAKIMEFYFQANDEQDNITRQTWYLNILCSLALDSYLQNKQIIKLLKNYSPARKGVRKRLSRSRYS